MDSHSHEDGETAPMPQPRPLTGEERADIEDKTRAVLQRIARDDNMPISSAGTELICDTMADVVERLNTYETLLLHHMISHLVGYVVSPSAMNDRQTLAANARLN